MPHTIRTERLTLRPASLRGARAFWHEVRRWPVMQNTSVWPYPLSYAHATFMLRKAWLEQEGTLVFFPMLGGEITGSIGLHRRGDTNEYTLGYMFGERLWGQGVASEVVPAVCRFGFRQLRADVIHAEVAADNPASARVLLKSGFEELPERRKGYSRARKAATELRVFRLEQRTAKWVPVRGGKLLHNENLACLTDSKKQSGTLGKERMAG